MFDRFENEQRDLTVRNAPWNQNQHQVHVGPVPATPHNHAIVVHPSPMHPVAPVYPHYPTPTYPVPYQHPYEPTYGPQHHPWHHHMGGHNPHRVTKVLKTIGVAVDCLGAAIAAIMPIPASPTIVGVQATDDENMKRYQEALAKHAKLDERIRTVGKVVREALSVKL